MFINYGFQLETDVTQKGARKDKIYAYTSF